MAQWLATEYVKVWLEVTRLELEQFVTFFRKEDLRSEIKVFDKRDYDVVISDEQEEIPLTFKNIDNRFAFSGSYNIVGPKLACAMRKAMKQFHGYAIVRRIYTGFYMTYYYENGIIVKIVEHSRSQERVIYEYSNFNGQLEWIYRNRGAETQIEQIKHQIDLLLDRRNEDGNLSEIDLRLQKLSHQLFILEA